MDTERAGFAAGAYFAFIVTGVAEDGSVDGLLQVDEDTVGTGEDNGVFDEIDHTATVLNMEVVRTLSDTEQDILSFASADVDEDGVYYDNDGGWGYTEFYNAAGDYSYSQLQGFEIVTGSSGDDMFYGSNQDENLSGGAGDDYIDGGDGDDTINGDGGDDFLYGQCGDDVLSGGDGCDTLVGGDDDDELSGGADSDLFANFNLGFADDENDVDNPYSGDDTYDGGDGDDIFLISSDDNNSNEIEGGDGTDYAHYYDESIRKARILVAVDDLIAVEEDVTEIDDVITDASGGFVLNVTDLYDVTDGGSVLISFNPDGPNDVEDDEDQDDENEGFVFDFLIKGKNVTETIIVGDVANATDRIEVTNAVEDALEARGYDVRRIDEGQIYIDGMDGMDVAVNDITPIGTLDTDLKTGEGLAAYSDQGEGILLDLRNSVMLGVTKLNLNTGAVIVSNSTFDYSDLEVSGPGFVTFMAISDDGEAVTNELEDGNLDPASSFFLFGGLEVIGGEGDDTLTGNDGGWAEFFFGDDGDDEIYGNGGNDEIDGGDGDDLIYGGDGDPDTDELADPECDFDDDEIDGGDGDDTIFGEQGDDYINGDDGDDFIGGDDVIDGGEGDDVIDGNGGDDTIDGGDGDDDLDGEEGDDVIDGGEGDDDISGGSGDDVIDGGDGDDDISGDDGDDVIDGGDGDDVINGGLGADVISGGAGDDLFDIDEYDDSRPTEGGPDEYLDFTHGEDCFDIVDLGNNWQENFNGDDNPGGIMKGFSRFLDVEVITGSISQSIEENFGFGVGDVPNPNWDVLIIEDGADALVIIDYNGDLSVDDAAAAGIDDVFDQTDIAFFVTDGAGVGSDGEFSFDRDGVLDGTDVPDSSEYQNPEFDGYDPADDVFGEYVWDDAFLYTA